MAAIGYVRCSTGLQVESGLGLEAQRASIMETAKRLSLDLVGLFSDEGLSGSIADRPGLLDAIAAIGKGDTLLVAARSRLGRDVVNVALVEREVAARGGKVFSCAGEGSELEGATGQLVRTILDAVAEHERAQVALRTRLALRALRDRGFRSGNVPFGFRAGEDGKLLPNDEERALVTSLQQLRAEGNSINEIVLRLHENGVRGRTGRPLGRTQVSRLLKRSA